jgi:hypothetical protein
MQQLAAQSAPEKVSVWEMCGTLEALEYCDLDEPHRALLWKTNFSTGFWGRFSMPWNGTLGAKARDFGGVFLIYYLYILNVSTYSRRMRSVDSVEKPVSAARAPRGKTE